MLALELRGERFNKAACNRELRAQLDGRSHGAVERKHQNISAILISLGFPYIDGYKPLGHGQDMLREVIREQLPPLLGLVEADVGAPQQRVAIEDVLGIHVDPPGSDVSLVAREEPARYGVVGPSSPAIDYLRKEALNRSLGDAGEALVMEYERARLLQAGKDRLARNVEQVSKTVGLRCGLEVIREVEIGDSSVRQLGAPVDAIDSVAACFGSWPEFAADRRQLDRGTIAQGPGATRAGR